MSITYRYNAIHIRRNLKETLCNLCATGKWDRTKTEFIPMVPGQPGYEEAKYECVVLYHKITTKELDEHSF